MADPQQVVTELEIASGEIQETLAPAGAAYRIRNFETGPNGTLRSVRGPCPYIPDYGAGYPSDYGRMHGLYHCRLGDGEREVLLLHSGSKLLHFNGWNAGNLGTVWEDLLTGLPNEDWAKFPTQFESDGRRVFIAMGMDQPIYAYDGFQIDILGYPQRPSGPTATASTRTGTTTNRLGTVDPSMGTVGGVLPGAWDYYLTLEDLWQDRSAPSTSSTLYAAGGDSTAVLGDNRIQAIVSVPRGRGKTRVRHVFRTPDRLNAGDITPREIYGSLGGGGDSAILPDNSSDVFVDNLPDGWLGESMEQLRTMPTCALLRVAMGRLWLGRALDDPGVLWRSKIGRMGTVGQFDFLYPDAAGAPLMGLGRVSDGLLAGTEAAVYLVTPTRAGGADDFQTYPVPGGRGISAPSSIATMPNGLTVWLGPGPAFYAFDGKEVHRVSDTIRQTLERSNGARLLQASASVNPRTGEYLCSLNDGGSTNDRLILVWDGRDWKERTDVTVRAMCTTRDHRGVVLVAGTNGPTTSGLWVLDHEGFGYTPVARDAIFESRFFLTGAPGERATYSYLILALRDGSQGTLSIQAYQDGSRAKVVSSTTTTVNLPYRPDPAPKWGTTTLGQAGAVWHNRRVHYKRVALHVPSAESVAFKLTAAGDIELVAYAWVRGVSAPAVGRIPE